MENVADGRKDSEIIRLILEGDKEIYRILVERYNSMLYGYALSLCRDHDDARDLVQTTFIAAYNALDRLRDGEAFPKWLSTIMRNNFITIKRKKSLNTVPLDDMVRKGFDPPDEKEIEVLDEEELSRIRNLILSLPEKYREVLVLRYLKEIPYKKIAEFLDIPISTVNMRLTYARKLLLSKAREGDLL